MARAPTRCGGMVGDPIVTADSEGQEIAGNEARPTKALEKKSENREPDPFS